MASCTNSPGCLSLRLSVLEMLLLALRGNSAFHRSARDCFSSVFSLWLLSFGLDSRKDSCWERHTAATSEFFRFSFITSFITVGSGSLSGLNSGVLGSLLYLCVAQNQQSALQQHQRKVMIITCYSLYLIITFSDPNDREKTFRHV